MIGWLLALPALVVLALGFGLPLAVLIRVSLNRTVETGAMETAFGLQTYRKILADDFLGQIALDTLGLAVGCAAAATVLALPVALAIRAAPRGWQGALALAAIAPLLVSGTGRIIGWLAILGDGGMVNALLLALGLPSLRLINNWTGVRIGLTESLMPYAVLVLLAGLGRLDPRLDEAAATLGAGRVRTFWRVTLPLAAPALLAAFALTLVLGLSAFITPKLMGGGRVFVIATEIFDLALETVDWPAAAALAMLLLLGVGALAALRWLLPERSR
ncbi:MAG: ABC transporter permease subunit [Elioraea sp.]|nr:ABC transporter permease subunit [Elioraea sp.]MDW8442878.1 ABC transporter permease subunit [Acetobacteraceae bacterium]